MIYAPTLVRFFIPTSLNIFDPLTEPTLEGLAGKSYFDDAIVSGGLAVNAMDTHPNRPLEVTTNGVNTEFRIDTALTEATDIDFHIVDQENLKEVYTVPPETDQLDIWHNSVDNFGTATKLTPVKTVNSYLGTEDPFNLGKKFILNEFANTNARYWFAQFNGDGVTAAAVAALIGQTLPGKIFTFNGFTPAGGYSGSDSYPGIMINNNLGGASQAEQKYGRKPSWSLSFAISTDAQFQLLQTMLANLKGNLYPFYISFDYDSSTPTIWRVRLANDESPFTFNFGQNQPWVLSLDIIADL